MFKKKLFVIMMCAIVLTGCGSKAPTKTEVETTQKETTIDELDLSTLLPDSDSILGELDYSITNDTRDDQKMCLIICQNCSKELAEKYAEACSENFPIKDLEADSDYSYMVNLYNKERTVTVDVIYRKEASKLEIMCKLAEEE